MAVIELLSPANKRSGSEGRREYLNKRDRVLRSDAHLMEVDFLRGGERLPMAAELPDANGFVILSRSRRRPIAEVWPLYLRERLPPIPIPLCGDDPDVIVDLQSIFDGVYQRARYDVVLDYTAPPRPALSPVDAEWVAAVLSA